MQNASARALWADEDSDVRRGQPDLRVVEPGAPVPNRRTVQITGHPTPPRRRSSARQQQIVARPDRVALYAVLLGLFMVLMAFATAHAGA
jgi:hypothetical protein